MIDVNYGRSSNRRITLDVEDGRNDSRKVRLGSKPNSILYMGVDDHQKRDHQTTRSLVILTTLGILYSYFMTYYTFNDIVLILNLSV